MVQEGKSQRNHRILADPRADPSQLHVQNLLVADLQWHRCTLEAGLLQQLSDRLNLSFQQTSLGAVQPVPGSTTGHTEPDAHCSEFGRHQLLTRMKEAQHRRQRAAAVLWLRQQLRREELRGAEALVRAHLGLARQTPSEGVLRGNVGAWCEASSSAKPQALEVGAAQAQSRWQDPLQHCQVIGIYLAARDFRGHSEVAGRASAT
mmetsp:Transcript_19495/g.43056  ORF Transcript_19495/g.43056 Transcript_19495/m.43056 type:complete len:205 (+) Transcript_19495:822-1436(+)